MPGTGIFYRRENVMKEEQPENVSVNESIISRVKSVLARRLKSIIYFPLEIGNEEVPGHPIEHSQDVPHSRDGIRPLLGSLYHTRDLVNQISHVS